MSQAKHTPGPWRTRQWTSQIAFVVGTDDEVIADNASHTNALLIAAAPDLLDDAKLTVLNFKRSRPDGKSLSNDEHDAWKALNRAIAKATGESA